MFENENQNNDKELMSHNYDGIYELDNPLPAWWLVTFLATIIFAFLYWIHYDIGRAGPSSDQELAEAMTEIESLQKRAAASGPSFDESTILALVRDSAALAEGKVEFAGKCAACHGASAEGLIGPNLTDPYWIHGGSTEAISKVISEGVLDKGMPAWNGLISPPLTNKVIAYIVSIKNTNVGGKEPQGEKVE